MNHIIDLNTFKIDDNFYGEVDLLLTVKSFNLQAIRKRYLASLKNISGRTGSTKRRELATGGIVEVTLKNGKVTSSKILVELAEPRGIVQHGKLLVVAAENTVYLLDGNNVRTLKNPWFSYIHTVDISPDGKRLLIASSGFDCLFEYDIESLTKTFEWFAWENGFSKGIDAQSNDEIFLTRKSNDAKEKVAEGMKVLFIENPVTQTLPTASRSAFINSVAYRTDKPDNVLATYFHEGKIYNINMNTGNATPVIENLTKPHGGLEHNGTLMATSTASGEVVCIKGSQETRYTFANLEGKPPELLNQEWLQNSIKIRDFFLTVDSNRTSFALFNPEKQLISMIPYDNNWALQDMVHYRPSQNHVNQLSHLG